MDRIDICLDAGHGGNRWAGRSSPAGVRGPSGTLEKDVTLRIAKSVAAHLGGKQIALTRHGDENRSLAERAGVSARGQARAFVSIHANAGRSGERGTETWVHARAGAASAELARALQQAVGALYGGGRGVQRGELAVLDPGRHLADTAACLLEVDYLTDGAGEQRLRDPGSVDRIGGAIAAGLRAYLDRGARATARALVVVGGDFAFHYRAASTEGPPQAVDGKILGVDPYSGQGLVDWNALRAAGKWFGIAKAFEYVLDNQFWNNWNGMWSAGLLRGAYDLFSERPAADQSRSFLNILPALRPGDLPPTLDIESTDNNHFIRDIEAQPNNNAKSTWVSGLSDRLLAWLQAVEKARGRRPLVYLGSFFREYFHGRGLDGPFAGYPLWLVNMGRAAPRPAESGPWQECAFWQYSEDHSTHEIEVPDPADPTKKKKKTVFTQVYGLAPYTEAGVNVRGIDFNAYMGTIHQLRALADLGTPAVVTRPDTRVYFGEPRTARGSAPSELYVGGRGFDPVSMVDRLGEMAVLGGDPVAVEGTDCVLWRGTDNHVVLMTGAGNDPPAAPFDLTLAARDADDPNAPVPDAAGDPGGYVADGQLRVLYVDITGEVHELWFDGIWLHRNVTRAAGTPPATSNALGVADAAGRHILFRAGDDGQLQEAFASGDRWEARVASFDAVTYEPAVWSDDSVLHVVYRGIDARLHEATPGATRDLPGSVDCAGNVVRYVVAGRRHYVYRGVDGHVYDVPGEIPTDGSGAAWDLHAQGATSGSGDAPPPAAADPAVYTGADGVPHVVFRAVDGSIYDLARVADDRWNGGFWRGAD